jgi:hypothetical protein
MRQPSRRNTYFLLWLEPGNGILVMRLMNTQFADCVLGNAFTYFLRLSREEADALYRP